MKSTENKFLLRLQLLSDEGGVCPVTDRALCVNCGDCGSERQASMHDIPMEVLFPPSASATFSSLQRSSRESNSEFDGRLLLRRGKQGGPWDPTFPALNNQIQTFLFFNVFYLVVRYCVLTSNSKSMGFISVIVVLPIRWRRVKNLIR